MLAHIGKRGEMLISIIIAMGILLILTQAIASLIFAAYDFVSFSKARTTARHIAQEQIEIIRNMRYSDIGTVAGIPAGDLPQNETITRNGQLYSVARSIIYVDDDYDGIAPTDTVPTDYKRIRVNVSWGGVAAGNVTFVTDASPPGAEVVTGGGTLSILILNALGGPLSQAQVHIVSTTSNPPVDVTQNTNVNGVLVLPGMPACSSCYRIEVTRDGYSSERTYSTAEIANPTNPDVTIIEEQLTEVSFAIDQLATLTISVVGESPTFSPLAGQAIQVQGSKVIGTTELDAPVYKYNEELIADSQGQIVITDLAWDLYEASPATSSAKIISSTNPLLPLSIEPASSVTSVIGLSDATGNSAFVTFFDATQTQAEQVTVTLTNTTGYEETFITGDLGTPNFGQVFFGGLDAGNYTIEAQGIGYQDFTDTLSVNGNDSFTLTLLDL